MWKRKTRTIDRAPDAQKDAVPAVPATAPAAGTETTGQADTTTTRSASLLVVPLVGVTSFAIFGQFATVYGYLDAGALLGLPDLASWKWLRLVLAIGAAAVFESMALFVQYQAHAMLLLKATATAAKHRRISYGFAAGAALLQYSHFSHDDWSPTSLALMFAAFSAAGPWLWGLHTRHVRHVHLLREGQADSIGATFSAERWRAFPIDTWKARRMSIDLGIDDPRRAWATYRARPVGELGGEQLLDVDPIDLADDDEGPAEVEVEVEEQDLDERHDEQDLDEQGDDEWFDDEDTQELDHVDTDDEQDADEVPAYRDKSLPIGDRIDLAYASEFAAGRPRPGRRRLAEKLLRVKEWEVRTELDRRAAASNGHNNPE